MASKFLSFSGEKALKELLKSTRGPSSQDHSQNWNVEDIKHRVTAKNLCSCRDPILMAFEVATITVTYRSNTFKSKCPQKSNKIKFL